MAFAISETQTVLWDQFQYQGAPEDFSWVLPVRPGAYVEVAADAWLSALDVFTSALVVAPNLNCGAGDAGGCTCGGASDDSASGASRGEGAGPPGVSVVRRERVGPYDTVVLRSEDPEALRDWLVVNGYAIPDEIQPVIDAYVDEGNDFLALRLAPGAGVSQMEPVRVITPGGDYLLPLRMIAAGVGSYVAITLFVIAEGRYTMPDMAEVGIDVRNLEYDYAAQSHNYLALRSAALSQNSGKSSLVPFARQRPFDTENVRPDNRIPIAYAPTSSSGAFPATSTTLADLYFAQARADAGRIPGTAETPCTPPFDGTTLVDAGNSAAFTCGGFSDLSTALVGMRPDRVWLTRFDMNLPSTALDADCFVEPAVEDVEVSPFLVPRKLVNPPCAPPLFSASTGSWMFGVWATSTLLARRRKRAQERC